MDRDREQTRADKKQTGTDESGQKQAETDGSGQKQTETDESGQKQTEIDEEQKRTDSKTGKDEGAGNGMTEDEIWEKRFRELAKKSYDSGCYTFTPFLSLDKLALFYRMEKELSYAGCCLSGGVEGAERQVVRFGDAQAFGYETDFPIVCLLVEALAPKFAEELTHRDFLGALMNLGIERELIGDIVVREKSGCIFCLERIAGYLTENLTRIRHTGVRLTVSDVVPETAKPRYSEEQVIVTSVRIDALIAKCYHLSRSESAGLFAAKKIFVGGRQCESAGYLCKDGDIVSVRGYGRFAVCGNFGVTGKGRVRVTLKIYR